ncbi:hypothetical protein J5N97_021846 [Dioscorea zingiberensis]|uniref:Uncharacterized protein n=1 Tax=Dioscorea zingiberensis TaxID=325984 RepID=A0A9D5C9N7_9LILI|nr:hypothetical protein J5N97_021846 [Dioscorea zingiberensis]
MYWGQNFGEGSIRDECGKYNYINIAFLTIFGNGTTPALDLHHCNPTVVVAPTSALKSNLARPKASREVQFRYTSDNAANLICTWYMWTASSVNTTFFMGLPASPNAAESGYLSPEVFNSQVQPAISRSSKYGGIMLWGVYYDPQYSSEVKPCAGVGKSCE